MRITRPNTLIISDFSLILINIWLKNISVNQMTYKIGKKTLEEIVLQSARNSGFSKKRLKAIEELLFTTSKQILSKGHKSCKK